jgi:Cys-tRNA(Pro)/Cys-tRNA(Cys) deacylase
MELQATTRRAGSVSNQRLRQALRKPDLERQSSTISWMTPSTPVTDALDQLAIEYRLFLHSEPVHSLQQAAEERGILPDQIVRSLVFRLEEGSFLLVLAGGPSNISWPKLRRYLGVKRMTTATAEEVVRVTGFVPGAVSPFGLSQNMRTLADESVLTHKHISLGAGIRNAGIMMKSRDLLKFLKLEVGDFAKEPLTE